MFLAGFDGLLLDRKNPFLCMELVFVRLENKANKCYTTSRKSSHVRKRLFL